MDTRGVSPHVIQISVALPALAGTAWPREGKKNWPIYVYENLKRSAKLLPAFDTAYRVATRGGGGGGPYM